MNGACCTSGRSITGYKLPALPGGDVPGGGVIIGGPRGGGIAEKIAAAFDAAVHGVGVGSNSGGGGNGAGNVIDFPMVNPYRPITRTRSVVAGLNARFPNVVNFNKRVSANFNQRDAIFNLKGERDADLDGMPEGATSLGFTSPSDSIPSGIGLPSGPSNLQLILGAITQGLQTVPAIISARKKQPYYDPNSPEYQTGASYAANGQAGANIGAQAGAAVGNVGDTIGNIVAQHPLLVLAGGAALFLMFMQPPRRR